MLRALVLALLLANLGFFTWSRGWLDDVVGVRAIGDREPERVTRQVRPELVRILPPQADAAPVSLSCLEAGPFGDAQLAAAEAVVQAALPPDSWTTLNRDRPATWIVYMGRYANGEALSRKEDELKRRQLAYEEIRDNATLAPGLALGRFDARDAAAKALEQLAQQGIRTARVVELATASSSHLLRVEKADPALAARVVALKADALGPGFAPCAAGGATGA